jgi:hypothetical protein
MAPRGLATGWIVLLPCQLLQSGSITMLKKREYQHVAARNDQDAFLQTYEHRFDLTNLHTMDAPYLNRGEKMGRCVYGYKYYHDLPVGPILQEELLSWLLAIAIPWMLWKYRRWSYESTEQSSIVRYLVNHDI